MVRFVPALGGGAAPRDGVVAEIPFAAGDSFGAAFLAGMAAGRSVDDAARGAMALAARVIQFRGALVPEIFEGGET